MKRYEVISALSQAIREILPENGYETDTGKDVYVAKRGQPSDRCEVWIYDLGQENSYRTNGLRESKLNVEVFIVSSEPYETLLKRIRDVYKALEGNSTLNGTASLLTIEEDKFVIAQEDKRYLGCSLTVSIVYHEEV